MIFQASVTINQFESVEGGTFVDWESNNRANGLQVKHLTTMRRGMTEFRIYELWRATDSNGQHIGSHLVAVGMDAETA